MRVHTILAFSSMIIGIGFPVSNCCAQQYTFTTFTIPSPGGQLTPGGINDNLAIVGTFANGTSQDPSPNPLLAMSEGNVAVDEGSSVGYIRTPDSNVHYYSPPSPYYNPFFTGINADGYISGFLDATPPAYPGYMSQYYAGGGFTLFAGIPSFFEVVQPGSQNFQTMPFGINNNRQTTGSIYLRSTPQRPNSVSTYAFIRNSDGTGYTFNLSAWIDPVTVATAINNSSQTVGSFTDASGGNQAFLRNSDGTYVTFTVRDALRDYISVVPTGITNSGVVVGSCRDTTTYQTHGFVRSVSGVVTVIDVPNFNYTYISGINNNNYITGKVIDTSGNTYAFIGTPSAPFAVTHAALAKPANARTAQKTATIPKGRKKRS